MGLPLGTPNSSKIDCYEWEKNHGLGYPYVDFYEVSNIKDMTYLKYRYINNISDNDNNSG